jgi:hypothetical protein
MKQIYVSVAAYEWLINIILFETEYSQYNARRMKRDANFLSCIPYAYLTCVHN